MTFDNDLSQAPLLPHGFMALYKCIFNFNFLPAKQLKIRDMWATYYVLSVGHVTIPYGSHCRRAKVKMVDAIWE